MIEFSEGWDRLDGCLHGAPGKYDALHAQVKSSSLLVLVVLVVVFDTMQALFSE